MPGMRLYILPRWSWLNIRTMANQNIGRWGWDFHTVRKGINSDDIRVRPRIVGIVDGRGALEPPPEDVAYTKRFDRKVAVRESHTEAETKKTYDRIQKKNYHILYIYHAWYISEGGSVRASWWATKRTRSGHGESPY